MIQSKGNNQFKDNMFDYHIWSAPFLHTQEEVVAKVKELKLVGRTIKDIQAIGYNSYFDNQYDSTPIFKAIQNGDDKALGLLDFPCEVHLVDPMLILFEDGDILGIDFSDWSTVRLELNTLPWGIQSGIASRNFYANRMFKDILGRKLDGVFITIAVGYFPAIHSVSFHCIYEGINSTNPRSLSFNFEPYIDETRFYLRNESNIMTLPAQRIKNIMEGYLTPEDIDGYLEY